MALQVKDVTEVYGALNDLGVDPDTPIGDRRLTTPADAIRHVLREHYTPDVLVNKNHFRGLVLASLPTRFPRRSSKSAYFAAMDVLAGTADSTINPQMMWYYYKVYIPEIDPRCIDLGKEPTADNNLLLQQVLSLDDTFMSIDLIEQGMNKKIATGTLVTVRFEDPKRALAPEIVEIGELIFPYDITGVQGQDKFPFGGDISTLRENSPGDFGAPRDNSQPLEGTGTVTNCNQTDLDHLSDPANWPQRWRTNWNIYARRDREKIEEAHDFFLLKYNDAAAAAMVGTLLSESGLKPDILGGYKGRAYGIAQWLGARKTTLQSEYPMTSATPYNTLDAQLNYIEFELKHTEANARSLLLDAGRGVGGVLGTAIYGAASFERFDGYISGQDGIYLDCPDYKGTHTGATGQEWKGRTYFALALYHGLWEIPA